MKITSKDLKTLIESIVRKEVKLNENADVLKQQSLEHWQVIVAHLNLDPADPASREAMTRFTHAVKKAYELGYESGWTDAGDAVVSDTDTF